MLWGGLLHSSPTPTPTHDLEPERPRTRSQLNQPNRRTDPFLDQSTPLQGAATYIVVWTNIYIYIHSLLVQCAFNEVLNFSRGRPHPDPLKSDILSVAMFMLRGFKRKQHDKARHCKSRWQTLSKYWVFKLSRKCP